MTILEELSPNSDDRPDGMAVDTVVLHATVLTTLEQVIQHFRNPENKVSAHYTIDRDGTIASHVPENRRAWHAGKSKMKDGRTGVNDWYAHTTDSALVQPDALRQFRLEKKFRRWVEPAKARIARRLASALRPRRSPGASSRRRAP